MKENYLPPEWDNEERMRVLLGPMPLAQDTVARAARTTFWSAALHQWCRTTKSPSFTLQEAQAAFRRGTLTPQCLPGVLHHMLSLGELVPLEQLGQGPTSQESWLGWGQRVLVVQPARLAWTKLKQVVGADSLQNTVLVDTVVLQELSAVVEEQWWSGRRGAVLSLGELQGLLGPSVGSTQVLLLVLDYLQHRGRVTSVTHRGTMYLGLAPPGQDTRPTITQLHLAECELEEARKQLEEQLSRLSSESSRMREEARAAVRDGDRTQALSLLRRRKVTEKSRTTQLAALDNVTICLTHLQQSHLNKQVLGAFRVGLEALRTTTTDVDAAAATMDDIQEVLAQCEELGDVLAEGGQPLAQLDTPGLEEELEQLLAQDPKEDFSDRMAGLTLPDVPSGRPQLSPEFSPQPTQPPGPALGDSF